jgi:hypothetical protein
VFLSLVFLEQTNTSLTFICGAKDDLLTTVNQSHTGAESTKTSCQWSPSAQCSIGRLIARATSPQLHIRFSCRSSMWSRYRSLRDSTRLCNEASTTRAGLCHLPPNDKIHSIDFILCRKSDTAQAPGVAIIHDQSSDLVYNSLEHSPKDCCTNVFLKVSRRRLGCCFVVGRSPIVATPGASTVEDDIVRVPIELAT